MPTTNSQPDKTNVQGLIMRGFTHPWSCHLIFKFSAQPGAKSFIKAILPYVQSAADWGDDKPEMMLNIGLTYTGIEVVGNLSANALLGFPITFMEGPASVNSQQSLNDFDTRTPNTWVFGRADKQVDCVVHVYGLDESALNKLIKIVADAAVAGDLTEYLPIANGTKRLEEYATVPRYSIHFGYLDGIDQPALGWGNPDDPADLSSFLIGYDNNTSQPGPSQGEAGDFAKDGCYNAFRMLHQDVNAFDTFLENNAKTIAPKIGKSVPDTVEWLAAKLNGRWKDGSPLELTPDKPNPAESHATAFGYSGDTSGMKCPFAAHNRVANPRDEVLSEPGLPPRLIRRGMAYGQPFTSTTVSEDRGLIGLFLCGSLANQFELLYSWINTTNFSNVFPSQRGQDALIANRNTAGADTSFIIPTPAGPIKIASLPQFVVARGTAYCLLPSISTLKSIVA
jgi:deferrochelatase/peroxidase EfeB